jgi:hypothetical protein
MTNRQIKDIVPKARPSCLNFVNVVTPNLRPLDFLPVKRYVQGARRAAYSSKAWIAELIAAAGPQVTETYIDSLTSSPPRSATGTLGLLTHGLAGSFLTGARIQADRQTVKQHMAAIRMLFSWLTEKGVLAMNPARESQDREIFTDRRENSGVRRRRSPKASGRGRRVHAHRPARSRSAWGPRLTSSPSLIHSVEQNPASPTRWR